VISRDNGEGLELRLAGCEEVRNWHIEMLEGSFLTREDVLEIIWIANQSPSIVVGEAPISMPQFIVGIIGPGGNPDGRGYDVQVCL
jgi:hypothetical protein